MKKRFAGLLLMVLTVACGSRDRGLEVEDVWGRASPAVAQNGAFYMTISNHSGEADALVDVRTEACGAVELHESHVDADDVMRMHPAAGGRIAVPAGEVVQLRTGGLHVMCLNKTVDFASGRRIALTLVFERAGEINVEAEIREDAP